MAVHMIRITVDPKTGDIAVDKPHIVIGIGDEIEWVSDDGVDFAVNFPYPNRRPFRSAVFQKRARTGAPVVSSGATKYKYDVHVDGAVLDPDVEVGDPPGGKGN
jgi:hypothetical protein